MMNIHDLHAKYQTIENLLEADLDLEEMLIDSPHYFKSMAFYKCDKYTVTTSNSFYGGTEVHCLKPATLTAVSLFHIYNTNRLFGIAKCTKVAFSAHSDEAYINTLLTEEITRKDNQ